MYMHATHGNLRGYGMVNMDFNAYTALWSDLQDLNEEESSTSHKITGKFPD